MTKRWLFGKEFIIYDTKEFRTYDTFDNPLFLVKQITKFIITLNVSQTLNKSEFMENIALIEQQRKA